MTKYFKNIISILLLSVYFFSTNGIIINYSLCFCSNKTSLGIFKIAESECGICKMKISENPEIQSNACQNKNINTFSTDCCQNQTFYFKYSPESCFINPFSEKAFDHLIFFLISTFIPDNNHNHNITSVLPSISPPLLSGIRLLIFLNQLDISPDDSN